VAFIHQAFIAQIPIPSTLITYESCQQCGDIFEMQLNLEFYTQTCA
jgi:hypothetical protein